jgi:outer membrane protein W
VAAINRGSSSFQVLAFTVEALSAGEDEMLRHVFALGFLAVVTALSAPFAAAQAASDPGLGAGVSASYTNATSADGGSLSGAVQVRARLTGSIAVEGLLTYRRETHSLAGERVLLVEEVPVQISGMLFFLTRGAVQPYVLGGIGYYYVHTKGEGARVGDGSHSENKFGFHGGAGVDVRVATRASLFADVRRVFLDVDAVKAIGQQSAFWQAGAGVNLYF